MWKALELQNFKHFAILRYRLYVSRTKNIKQVWTYTVVIKMKHGEIVYCLCIYIESCVIEIVFLS